MTATNSQDAVQRPKVTRADETRSNIPVRRYWLYILAVGTAIVLGGAWIMAANPANAWGFLCGLPLVLLGALGLWLAENARSGHWVYVNVEENDGGGKHRVRVVSPLPIGLARGGLWVARQFTPRLDQTLSEKGIDADAMLVALDEGLTDEQGITIEVDDDDSQVQVYIV